MYIQDNSAAVAEEATGRRTLDSYYSDKQLGSFIKDGKTYFRLFTPNAIKVILVTFNRVEDETGDEYEMSRDENAVWEVVLDGEHHGLYYGFKVYNSDNDEENKPLCVDPYSKAVATYNTYLNPRKSIVYQKEFDWEDDSVAIPDWSDLIIYEMHVRDMTAHPSSGAKYPGTYKGLTEKGITGGIDYIKSLGVNSVELLPVHEFGNIEIPYKKNYKGRFNKWNPYERNHWGYMTASYFAPAAYYGEDRDSFKWNTWTGRDGGQVNEFKKLVKSFHEEGLNVILDVVFNHLSEYELGNLKQIDENYYFRLHENGKHLSESFCGNDLKTEHPMVRKLIVDSILYWMKEYHIDGFRFDLAKLIDWQTVEDIIHEAKKVNPDVIIIAEPWGGGYDPHGFSHRGWAAWNDQIRNGIKGENPVNGHGWLFGKWYGNNDTARIKSYVRGTTTNDKFGIFSTKEHSVNYLESHDGYTLGDFIRIGSGGKKADAIINNIDKNAKLNPRQMKLNKLGALFLLTSRGIAMIHAGQEFARSKVIQPENNIQDAQAGMIDHNSYNKDNFTNYINYHHAELNEELVDYYKGLIKLRNKYPAFRRAHYKNIHFASDKKNRFHIAYSLIYENEHFFIMFNSNPDKDSYLFLPGGKWDVLVNYDKAGVESLGAAEGDYLLHRQTGAVLKKQHQV